MDLMFRHVKGRSEAVGNERADWLANRGRKGHGQPVRWQAFPVTPPSAAAPLARATAPRRHDFDDADADFDAFDDEDERRACEEAARFQYWAEAPADDAPPEPLDATSARAQQHTDSRADRGRAAPTPPTEHAARPGPVGPDAT